MVNLKGVNKSEVVIVRELLDVVRKNHDLHDALEELDISDEEFEETFKKFWEAVEKL